MTTHEGGRGGPTRATGPMIFILTLAMALPMLLLYAIGVLGPVLVSDLRISRSTLGSLTAVCFAVAAVLSLWAARESAGSAPAMPRSRCSASWRCPSG
ncbi:hypothetical protein ACFQ0O_20360 [Saccharopolyspora spinosporotrichia]